MNGEETRELWDMGPEAWNAWAAEIEKTRTNFEAAGAFCLNFFGEGENEESRLWVKASTADFSNHTFVDDIDLSLYQFPGLVLFNGAIFERSVSFRGARFKQAARFSRAQFRKEAIFAHVKFEGQALFDETAFEDAVSFEHAEFLKEQNGPLSASVKFQRACFSGKTDFRAAAFSGNADFSRAQFAANLRFDGAQFRTDALFDGAIFSAPAAFNAARFLGDAGFKETQFTGEARFAETVFGKKLNLDNAQFWQDASFREARFGEEASFVDVRVEGKSRFVGAKFATGADFSRARFAQAADFVSVEFGGPATFLEATFAGGVFLTQCRFLSPADFSGLSFEGEASFEASEFAADAQFRLAKFSGPVSLARARFAAAADFTAIASTVAFVVSDAEFSQVPSFLEASFHEPPRLDHMEVRDPLKRFHRFRDSSDKDPRPIVFRLMKVCKDKDASAKFRRLKKLAFEGQDHARELEFFAQEMRCRRFWHDGPFGPNAAKFWLGWLYGGAANFGRSLSRPALLWALCVLLFAGLYIGQRAEGIVAEFSALRSLNAAGQMLAAKAQCVSGQSNALLESLFISARHALLATGFDEAVAKRSFGCLYGLEPSGSPLVPTGVSLLALAENVAGGLLIFLFLLGLRNLLKMR